MKKKLTKLKNQRKLFNPLKLVTDQINFNYKLNIIFFKLHNIDVKLNNYTYKLNILKTNLYKSSYNILLNFILKKSIIDLNTVNKSFTYLNRNVNKKLNLSLSLYQNNEFYNYFYNKFNLKNELIKVKNSLFNYININYLTTNFKFNKNLYFIIPNLSNNLKYTILGYKIMGFGRLGFSSKSTRKSKTIYLRGKTTLNSLNTLIDYTNDISIIRNGVYGIKIYKFYREYQYNIPNKLMNYY